MYNMKHRLFSNSLTQTSLELVTAASASHVLRLQVCDVTPGLLIGGTLAAWLEMQTLP